MCMSVHIDIRADNVLALSFSTMSYSVYFLQKFMVYIYMYLLGHIIAFVADCQSITNLPRYFLCLLFMVLGRYNSTGFRKSISAWIYELHITAGVLESCCQKLVRIYRVFQEECARLREGVPYVKVYRYNPKHLCPKLNGYGDNGQRNLKL